MEISLIELESNAIQIESSLIQLQSSQIQLVTGCNPNDLDIWTDWCRLGLQFVVYKSAEQELSCIN